MQTKERANAAYETQLNDWIVQEKAAIELIGTIGKLWFEKSIELILFRNQLVDRSVSEIMNLHLYAKNIVKKTISVNDTLAIATAINNAAVCPSRIDIGKLTYEYQQEKSNFKSVDEFILNKLKDLIGAKSTVTPKDVVLYGFGRIGRLAARELIKQAGKGQQLRFRAIVTRGSSDADIIKRASLLRNDSVHGDFRGTVIEDLENKALIINGQIVKMIDASNPEDVDYTTYGINNALIIDNTGVFTNREALSRHLKAKGAGKVLLLHLEKKFQMWFMVSIKELWMLRMKIFSLLLLVQPMQSLLFYKLLKKL
jgi:glyceraldehyde 3-phosphate dehydrogenase